MFKVTTQLGDITFWPQDGQIKNAIDSTAEARFGKGSKEVAWLDHAIKSGEIDTPPESEALIEFMRTNIRDTLVSAITIYESEVEVDLALKYIFPLTPLPEILKGKVPNCNIKDGGVNFWIPCEEKGLPEQIPVPSEFAGFPKQVVSTFALLSMENINWDISLTPHPQNILVTINSPIEDCENIKQRQEWLDNFGYQIDRCYHALRHVYGEHL